MNAKYFDDNILTRRLLYTFIRCFCSLCLTDLYHSHPLQCSIFAFFVVVVANGSIVGTMEVENVYHCENVALCLLCADSMLAFVA